MARHPLSPLSRQAAIWALISAAFSASAIAIFIYLYVVREVRHRAPSRWVLLAFGLLSSVALAASFGAFVSYLGLGIIDSIHHAGEMTLESLTYSLGHTHTHTHLIRIPYKSSPLPYRKAFIPHVLHLLCVDAGHVSSSPHPILLLHCLPQVLP